MSSSSIVCLPNPENHPPSVRSAPHYSWLSILCSVPLYMQPESAVALAQPAALLCVKRSTALPIWFCGVHHCPEDSSDHNTLMNSLSCSLQIWYLMLMGSEYTSHCPHSCSQKMVYQKAHAHTHMKERGRQRQKCPLSVSYLQFPQNTVNNPLHCQEHLKDIFVTDWLY